MKKFSEKFPEFDNSYTRIICIAMAFLFAFSIGNFCGGLTNIKTFNGTLAVEAAVNEEKTEPQTQAVAADTQAAAEESTTAAQADNEQTTAAASSGAPSAMTTDEIIALFNQSSDKVKTDATKVVKNFEKRSSLPEKTVVPSALQGTANSLMEQFMKDDLEPIEYSGNADIVANYPVPGQSYSSKLTAADVKEATCTDNGTEYEITIKLNDSQNPTAGTGVGAACDVIEAAEVTSNGAVAAIMKSFTINYYDCVIKCKIDKATNHITWSSYTTPLIIDCQVSVLVSTVDATVGLSFEKDYTVTY